MLARDWAVSERDDLAYDMTSLLLGFSLNLYLFFYSLPVNTDDFFELTVTLDALLI